MQEQESDSLFIENDPAVADIQSADSPDKRTGPLSTKGWKSSLDRLSQCKGTPKYFKGKDPTGQEKIWAQLWVSSISKFTGLIHSCEN